ncbi:DEAD/DEAH box helicase family protein [Brucella pseudogrignonensis]|uniref:Type III restriction enzyme n=1 Tax=Brucella pseudogrignonensis TaxID=419475 RepID=A0ABU1M3F1_9HYPH|nr:DEAD/DEAH box helicase family protein [Brucella pseudogrignonensis]MDR6430537.1 type III restriction enzyme [Brucella pseudogrignonensis]
MEFKFDAAQQFQLDAISSVVGLLDGQGHIGSMLVPAAGATVVPNRLDMTDYQLLANLNRVQTNNGLKADTALAMIEQDVDLFEGRGKVWFPNFTVEMETGTGKTYVYLRTALNLAQRYGLTKFIIVVPSVAVREGVLKTIRQTKAHFSTLPGLPPFHHSVYAAQPGQIRSFAASNAVELMVMTIDAFSREQNVIRKPQEGNPPVIHLLQAVRPVLIMDEPQNMESEGRIAALAALNPLFALRYSATHRNAYNPVYRLTPFDAYRQGLVKQIEVGAAIEEVNANLPYIRVENIDTANKSLTAQLTVDVQAKSGKITRKTIKVKHGDKLWEKANRTDYDGLEIAEINFQAGYVRFTNNAEVALGGETGMHRDAVLEAQIRFTVERHFQKQKRIRDLGFNVKVLSLFFVDKVESFRDESGLIRKLFIKAFNEAKVAYPEWRDKDPNDVQASYFASTTNKKGVVSVVEKEVPTNEKDRAAQAREFDLIMRRKEDLISFEEPVAFIFSHSALKEGWDNPNVFQICTLREVGSETERRQQVGRGVRLPVDSLTGERVQDNRVNILTVSASETYESFVTRLQSEIEKEYGKEGVPPQPGNARDKVILKLRKAHLLKPEFQELWERIKYRTRYSVEIDSGKLVSDVAAELPEVKVRRPRVVVQVAGISAKTSEDLFEAIRLADASVAIDLEGRYPIPNIVSIIENLMEATSPPMRIGRQTILQILKAAPDPKAMTDNPHEFAAALVGILKDKLADQLVGGIKYERDGSWYEQTQFDELIETFASNVVKSEPNAFGGGTHIYDGVVVDSDTIERPFAEGLERDARVKLYVKLPGWFKVSTPITAYNPDWAIVMDMGDGKDRLYLIRETKPKDLANLRPDERRKIECGKKHFIDTLGQDYKVISDVSELV